MSGENFHSVPATPNTNNNNNPTTPLLPGNLPGNNSPTGEEKAVEAAIVEDQEAVPDSEPERERERARRMNARHERSNQSSAGDSSGDEGSYYSPSGRHYRGKRSLLKSLLAEMIFSSSRRPSKRHTKPSSPNHSTHGDSDEEDDNPVLFSNAIKESETNYEPFIAIRKQLKNYLRSFRLGDMHPDVYHRLVAEAMGQGNDAYEEIHKKRENR